MQKIITPEDNYHSLDEWLRDKEKVFLVCGRSIEGLHAFRRKMEEITTPIIRFSDFKPNPLYESVTAGVELFREQQCDSIMAVGGGSAIDVAKCIRQSAGGEVPFLVMPTTAGTGSEATRYAVVYRDGVKQSITGDNLIPETVLMDPGALKTLPLYQRKATMCDALCHALESFWSVNSTNESKEYSREAIKGILRNLDGYLNNTDEGNTGMLMAANTAGRAINITQTTAGHAMCYKITSMFDVSHGHAAMLCDRVLYPRMIENSGKTVDPRGEEYLKKILDEIGRSLGGVDALSGARKLNELFSSLELSVPVADDAQFAELKVSVNSTRLKNHPVKLDEDTIDELYHEILKEGAR